MMLMRYWTIKRGQPTVKNKAEWENTGEKRGTNPGQGGYSFKPISEMYATQFERI